MTEFSYTYIDNQLVRFKIIYSNKLKNIYLRIDKNLEIEVKAPFYTDIKYIRKLVDEKYYQLQKIKTKKENTTNFNLKNNVVSILGKTYTLQIVPTLSKQTFKILEDKIVLNLNNLNQKEKVLRRVLLKEAKRLIVPMCEQIINKYNFVVNKISIKWMTSVWGHCKKQKKEITFSSRLVTFRKEVIEYVIYHELAHLIEANHSSQFWMIVQKLCPNYKALRNELKTFG